MGMLTGDTSLQSSVLEDLTQAHRYRRWLADLARPHLGDHPVEIGSGTGDYALEWVSDVRAFTATEADEARFATLQSRFAGHPVIQTRWLVLGDSSAPLERKPGSSDPHHSAAVAFNVLEHIPDDVAALRELAALVRPGGVVVLIVPAFPSAMSRFDRAIGHQRRYTRASLAAALDAAGLVPEQLRYVNPVGLVSWYVTVKALGLTPRDGAALRVYDRFVVPFARLVDRAHLPFGQSVFAVARAPG